MESDELTLDVEGVADGEPSEPESAGSYSRVKKGRFVPFLELRRYNGDSVGLRYTHMHPIAFNKSDGIIIDAPPVRVLIKGRNLGGLWRYLLQESVSWIKELPESMDDKDAAETVVHSFELLNGEVYQGEEEG